MAARHIGWFIVVTGMITALPLIFEVKQYCGCILVYVTADVHLIVCIYRLSGKL